MNGVFTEGRLTKDVLADFTSACVSSGTEFAGILFGCGWSRRWVSGGERKCGTRGHEHVV